MSCKKLLVCKDSGYIGVGERGKGDRRKGRGRWEKVGRIRETKGEREKRRGEGEKREREGGGKRQNQDTPVPSSCKVEQKLRYCNDPKFSGQIGLGKHCRPRSDCS